ncbi:PPC domain-containing DNA-binding protein [Trabulsiella odontotermitis]|uniref:PPC domain-containing DNA-binding protein n=1 Tax=Trabulsiella odontotermitis TaxID=379893 RepID=UPI0006767E3E|nr:PPC domain-containing DNA-binding protein [Trabulsiella odontotermitis]KNC92601.1 DNA-binding protein [Trabulsiella odontotermitis]
MTPLTPHVSSARFWAFRLLPGQEIFSQLRRFMENHQIQAGWIAGCTGSLTDVALRYAGREETTRLTGKFEIISLNGTIELAAEHLHLSIADPDGAMLGGHMMPGCTVRTTLEIVVGELTALAFTRAPCPFSGYDELVIAPR